MNLEDLVQFIPFLIPLLIIQLTLMGFAVYHILTHENYKRGSRVIWLVVSICINFIGPILYFSLGKEEE